MAWHLAATFWFQAAPELQTVESVANVVAGLGPTGLLGAGLYFMARELRRIQKRLEESEAARLAEAKASAEAMLAFLRKANPSNP